MLFWGWHEVVFESWNIARIPTRKQHSMLKRHFNQKTFSTKCPFAIRNQKFRQRMEWCFCKFTMVWFFSSNLMPENLTLEQHPLVTIWVNLFLFLFSSGFDFHEIYWKWLCMMWWSFNEILLGELEIFVILQVQWNGNWTKPVRFNQIEIKSLWVCRKDSYPTTEINDGAHIIHRWLSQQCECHCVANGAVVHNSPVLFCVWRKKERKVHGRRK